VTERADFAKRLEYALEAVRLNSWQAEYRIFASRLYLGRALSELQRPKAEQDEGGIARDVQRALAYSRGDVLENQKITGAVELAPNRVASWETLGAVYRDITFAPGALEWGIHSFETALVLDPANPVLRVELGKLYVAKKDLPKAREQFQKAVALKPDFVEGIGQLALLAEHEGNAKEAIAAMLALSLKYPGDPETLFQLGRLYYNNGETQKAISQFQQVLSLAPNHSNALFALGVAYEKEGDTKKAVQEFERVLQFNPGNEAVQLKLQELQK
jgi:Flp pilus assembly protein TadD